MVIRKWGCDWVRGATLIQVTTTLQSSTKNAFLDVPNVTSAISNSGPQFRHRDRMGSSVDLQVMYPKLSAPTAFSVIADKINYTFGDWRPLGSVARDY